MRTRTFLALLAASTAPSVLDAATAGAPAVVSSTLDDQTRVAVTVYNTDLGLVRDERRIVLPEGSLCLRLMDVAARVLPETVQIEPVTAGPRLQVLEQNYEYDLLSPEKVLEKYVGQEVTIVRRNEFKDEAIPIKARLLSYNNAQPIYEIKGTIVLYQPHAETILPALPENLVARPTLTWLLENSFTQEQVVATTYLTEGMGWKADYVAVLGGDERTMRINGWVTIQNNSGTTFKNAQLKLVAGDVQRVSAGRGGVEMLMAAPAAKAAFAQEEMFEYHLYTLQRPTTLKQNQQKQIALLEAPQVRVQKSFRTSGESGLYRTHYVGTGLRTAKIDVYLRFTNSVENGLGMPLPGGTLRVYKADASGNNQFIGEDRIAHTPKNEVIELRVGTAFDLVADRRQMDYRVLGDNVFETAWQVTLRNHKEEDVTVEVIEPLGGDWEILKSTHTPVKKDAFTVVFYVPVAKQGSAVCEYRVRVRWR
ncbi:MAG: DUF4139 domain-containing protein [bacterium]|nr:DUF4139 domain-containing protein [bacterium]